MCFCVTFLLSVISYYVQKDYICGLSNLKPNEMRKTKRKGNVYLREKKLSNGNISLYLDVYRDGKREYEFLKLYLNAKARTPMEKEQNQRTLLMAEDIRTQREIEVNSSAFGLQSSMARNADFIDYFREYIRQYTKKDIKVLSGALRRFQDFIKKEYGSKYEKGIKVRQLDKDMMIRFVDYLHSRSVGEGAHTFYQRFKKVVNSAVESCIIYKSPCSGIVCKADINALKKDILSIEEMNVLINCTYPGQNQDIRRAFIFCLYCGLRYCDVSRLRFTNIDYSNKLLKFEQTKTKGLSSKSSVVIPLNDGLINLIGQPPRNADDKPLKDTLIFRLPCMSVCHKALSKWMTEAGIDKHITWHCARHSFAVNILNKGANIKTVSSLLGHSTLKYTEKYTRAVDSLKEMAINSLPELKL